MSSISFPSKFTPCKTKLSWLHLAYQLINILQIWFVLTIGRESENFLKSKMRCVTFRFKSDLELLKQLTHINTPLRRNPNLIESAFQHLLEHKENESLENEVYWITDTLFLCVDTIFEPIPEYINKDNKVLMCVKIEVTGRKPFLKWWHKKN